MANKGITFQQVVQQLNTFREERGWHDLAPADLAKSIVLEAAELLEHYQWDSTDLKRHGAVTKKAKSEIASEAADIFIYLLEFCQENDINLLEAARQKIKHNVKKYPAKEMKNGGRQAYERSKKAHRSLK